MTYYYINVAADDTPTGYFSRASALSGYNTAADSATNGKPYIIPVDVGNVSIATPTQYQVLGTPSLNIAGTPSITVAAAYKSLSECKTVKLAELATYRYEQEIGGITVGGVAVDTDRDTQAILTAARIYAKEDASYTVNWKKSDGTFVTLDDTTIIAIADAMAAHVQACFDNEKDHVTAINALTTAAEVAAYDMTTGW